MRVVHERALCVCTHTAHSTHVSDGEERGGLREGKRGIAHACHLRIRYELPLLTHLPDHGGAPAEGGYYGLQVLPQALAVAAE